MDLNEDTIQTVFFIGLTFILIRNWQAISIRSLQKDISIRHLNHAHTYKDEHNSIIATVKYIHKSQTRLFFRQQDCCCKADKWACTLHLNKGSPTKWALKWRAPATNGCPFRTRSWMDVHLQMEPMQLLTSHQCVNVSYLQLCFQLLFAQKWKCSDQEVLFFSLTAAVAPQIFKLLGWATYSEKESIFLSEWSQESMAAKSTQEILTFNCHWRK